jgi:hypothetical protein
MGERIFVLILLLFLSLLPSGDLRAEKQFSLIPGSGDKTKDQKDLSSSALSCEEILNTAISLNENFKSSVSAGGQRAFRLEVEKYFDTVLLEKISSCVTYATTHSDVALSKLLFELAYSYSNSADEVIDLELARLYSRDQEMTKTILLNCEKSKRHELIEILKWGLDNLYYNKAEEAARLMKLKQLLNELDSK